MYKGEDAALELIDLVKNDNREMRFREIDRFFPVTNEDIRQCSNVFDYQDKNVLTVCGSGDQVFNAIALGAKEIMTFDINIVALYHLELKKAIIEDFNLKDFVLFYEKGLSVKTYTKVRDKLKGECLKFWDTMYASNKKMIKYFWDHIFEDYIEYMGYFNPYLDNEKYELLKEKLKIVKIKSIQSDILNLKGKINQQFDIMNFSNVLNVLKFNIQDSKVNESMLNSLKWYKRIIEEHFLEHLNQDGKILVGYYFGGFSYNSVMSSEVENFFIENPGFSIYEFITYDVFGPGSENHILTYKK